jgi:hypothetical protein
MIRAFGAHCQERTPALQQEEGRDGVVSESDRMIDFVLEVAWRVRLAPRLSGHGG